MPNKFQLVAVMAACGALVLAETVAQDEDIDRAHIAFSHIQKISTGTFSHEELKACKMFLAKADPAERPRWIAVLACYRTIAGNNPLAALATVGPVLVGEEKTRQWQSAQSEAELKKVSEQEKNPASQRNDGDENLHSRLLAPFPPVEEWMVDGITAECAVEAVRAHLALREYETALQQVSRIGPNLGGMAQVLAGECGGDLLMAMQRYEQAGSFYQYALHCLAQQRNQPLPVFAADAKPPRKTAPPRAKPARKSGKKPGAEEMELLEPELSEPQFERSPTDDEYYLAQRITESLSAATRLFDIERYGEDFVLYREAEKMRRELDQYLEAHLAYDEIEEKFAGTMYAEAAKAYRIKCLLALAEPENAEQAHKTILATKELLHSKRKQLTAARRKNLTSEQILSIQENIAENGQKLAMMTKVPLGRAAANAAQEAARKFLAENEYGLYRGEVIEAVADYELETIYNPDLAAEDYQRALAWFDKAEEFYSELDAFKVPDKSKSVSAPPPEMKAKDAWGNRDWAKMDGGKLFNQRTSGWYLPYHRMMAQTKRALCSFIVGQPEEALEMLDIILEVDLAENMSFELGMPNTYSRLKAEFEQGRMFATAKELDAFSGKAQAAIIVADYYYEIEQWKEAARRYRRIDREMRDTLGNNACAYLDFMLANSAIMADGDEKKALTYLSKFKVEYKHAPTWPRAMLALFTIYQNKGERDQALNTLRQICKRMPNSEWGRRAYYHQGEYFYALGQTKEAQEIFEACCKQYEGTWLARGARQYLAKIRNEKK